MKLLLDVIALPLAWLAMMAVALPFAFVWVWAWNTSVVQIFGWPVVTFWQMYALSILVGVMPSRVTIARHES